MRTVPDDGYFTTLLDEDGTPPCDPPDACDVCRLFGEQRPDESREDWLERITGYPLTVLEEAS